MVRFAVMSLMPKFPTGDTWAVFVTTSCGLRVGMEVEVVRFAVMSLMPKFPTGDTWAVFGDNKSW